MHADVRIQVGKTLIVICPGTYVLIYSRRRRRGRSKQSWDDNTRQTMKVRLF
jgi:hypothetical protein